MIQKLLSLSFAAIIVGSASIALFPTRADAFGLRGSPSSMKAQHAIAVEEEMTFMDNARQVQALVAKGGLETVTPNADFTLSRVSFPYARREVRLFVEKISAEYHKETGDLLVVTSLTRPIALQPRNAHELSVHPAGMAVDFRIPAKLASRTWLEHALLDLERADVLDVTRERTPAHYHVAVFPAEYLAYATRQDTETKGGLRAAAQAAVASAALSPAQPSGPNLLVPIIALMLTLLVAATPRLTRLR